MTASRDHTDACQANTARATSAFRRRRFLDILARTVGAASIALAFNTAQAWPNAGTTDEVNAHFVPNGTPNSFEWDFQGDLTAIIPPQTYDPSINAFDWMNYYLGTASNPTTVTYDPALDITRVVQSGDPLPSTVPPDYTPWALDTYPDGNPTYHSGINMGNSGFYLWGAFMSSHWSYPSAEPFEFGAVEVRWDGTFKKKITKTLPWLLTYIETLDPMTRKFVSGNWEVKPYDPLKPKTFSLVNHGHQPIIVKTIGYIPNVPAPADPDCRTNPQCEENQEMLESLNRDGYPVPGQPGSQFTVVKPPKAAIPPGGSFTVKIH